MYKVIFVLFMAILPGLAGAQTTVYYDKEGERIVFNDSEYYYRVRYLSEQEDGSFKFRSGEIWPGNSISPSVSSRVISDEGLQPGHSQEGFVITHSGLPALIEYRASSKSTWSFPDQGMRGEVRKLAYKILEDTEYVSGQTVGPRSIPDPFVATEFLDSILAYNEESETLGWIADSTLASSIGFYLHATQKSLQQNDNTSASTSLEILLANIEEEYRNGTDLSDEAYALLIYNIAYLLERITG